MIEWFKHDVHCLQDDRLFALVSRYGMEGYAIFFHAIEAMYASNGEPLSEISVRRIAFDFGTTVEKVQDVLGYAASESCDFLLMNDGSGFTSERVLEECGKHSEKVSKMQSLANKRWNAERNAERITEGNAKRNADKIRQDKNRYELSNDNSCSELFDNSSEADGKDPVFITLPLINGEDYPIKESDVKIWEEAYPAVDVRGQLREMKAWCNSNPKERKTAKGIMRFCNNWLSREQDKSGRYDAKSKPIKHKDYSDIKDEDLEKEFHWT